MGLAGRFEAVRAAQAAAMEGFVDPRSRTVAESAACGVLGSVGESASVGDSGYVGAGGCGCGRAVCVGSLDVGSVRVGELLDLMVDLGRARAQVEGMLMAVAGEVARRNGWQSAAWLMREHNRVPAAQARAEASLAHTLVAEDLDETVTALSEGDITLSHARVVARAARKDHTKPEAELLELARAYPSDVVGRHILACESAETHAAEAAERQAKEDAKYGSGPAADELRSQRAARRGRMVLGEDGMWHLSASFDAITGRRVHQIYEAAMRAMRNRPGSADHSHAQRGADVVAELFGGHSDCHPPADHPGGAGGLRPRQRPPRQPAARRRHPDPRRSRRRARGAGPGHAGALRRQLAEHRHRHQPQPQRSPTPPPRGPRRRLHRLRSPLRGNSGAPHPVLGERRPHSRLEPGPAVPHLPRPRSRTALPGPHPHRRAPQTPPPRPPPPHQPPAGNQPHPPNLTRARIRASGGEPLTPCASPERRFTGSIRTQHAYLRRRNANAGATPTPAQRQRRRNANARGPAILAAQRREQARTRSEKGHRWGWPTRTRSWYRVEALGPSRRRVILRSLCDAIGVRRRTIMVLEA